ncbi:YfcC family protein [Actinomyces sp. zg-332]|uniref:YfcC family protein n=1 Tax=Actinomyces sp. zg-332 TaxID=2708340 RepID=UPI00141F4A4A|nr:YfcC family protein [Actinomyces sp. zg-332]QPK94442.1 YfcC family protein [Actinomyces sp. zg-332]
MNKTKKFSMPTAYTILFALIAVVAALTWIVPAGQYETKEIAGKQIPVPGTYHAIENTPQGIFEVLSAPILGFYNALQVAFFIMILGGFIGVTLKTGALDAGFASITRALKGKEKIMIFLLISLFAFGGTSYGMAEETIPFYPLIIVVILSAGYDTITGVAVILLGAGIGCLASTVNPFAVGIASNFAETSMGNGLILRALMLVVGIIITYIFVISYAEKVKADPTKSVVFSTREDDMKHFLHSNNGSEQPEMTWRRRLALIAFAGTFIFMVFSLIPFSDMGITAIPTLGWSFKELSVLFLTMSIIVGVAYGLKESEITESFIDGMRDLLGVSVIIGISNGITIVMNDGNMTATILNLGESSLSSLGQIPFVILTYIFYIPMSFLVPSSSGLATLSMPIMAPLADFAGVTRDIVVTAYQSASGLVNFITPTSAVVMSALAIGRISYDKWIKYIWKYLLAIFVYTIVFLLIGIYI